MLHILHYSSGFLWLSHGLRTEDCRYDPVSACFVQKAAGSRFRACGNMWEHIGESCFQRPHAESEVRFAGDSSCLHAA